MSFERRHVKYVKLVSTTPICVSAIRRRGGTSSVTFKGDVVFRCFLNEPTVSLSLIASGRVFKTATAA